MALTTTLTKKLGRVNTKNMVLSSRVSNLLTQLLVVIALVQVDHSHFMYALSRKIWISQNPSSVVSWMMVLLIYAFCSLLHVNLNTSFHTEIINNVKGLLIPNTVNTADSHAHIRVIKVLDKALFDQFN